MVSGNPMEGGTRQMTDKNETRSERNARKFAEFKNMIAENIENAYLDKALARASWIVEPPVKNILRHHQINRKRNLKSGSTFGRVYGTPMK
jgi:hypothetical protein